MKLVPLVAIGFCLAALVLSCETIQELRVEAPPANAAQARQWWQKTVAEMSPDTLAVYVQVSQELRRKQATATYCFTQVSRAKTTWMQREVQLPAPLPDAYLAQARARLAGYQRQRPVAPSMDKEITLTALPGTNCTDEQALDLWRQQEVRLGWKRPAGL